MSENLPVPDEDAADIAKFSSGVFAVAIAALYPEMACLAGMGQVAVSFAVDRYLKKPQAVLAAELKAGNLSVLTDEQKAAFVPMAFRFFEAARQGEYEHNLEILAAFVANEMHNELPDAGSVSQMAHRIQGMSKECLSFISVIRSLLSSHTLQTEDGSKINTFKLEELLKYERIKCISNDIIQQSVADVKNRGFLIEQTVAAFGASLPFYTVTPAFHQLVQSAEAKFDIPSQ